MTATFQAPVESTTNDAQSLARALRLDLELLLTKPAPMTKSVERSLWEFRVPGKRVIAEYFEYNLIDFTYRDDRNNSFSIWLRER